MREVIRAGSTAVYSMLFADNPLSWHCQGFGNPPGLNRELGRLQGVSIVPACVRNLQSRGVRFYRLQPDDVRIELVAAWKKQTPCVALRAFPKTPSRSITFGVP